MNTKTNSPEVLVLCGGKGERLRPITEDIPKPMVPIDGRPILDYILSYFQSHGFDRFVIAVGYKADRIREYLNLNHSDKRIKIVDSGDVDILQRIQGALSVLDGDFLVCYGDTLADVDIPGLLRFHKAHGGPISVTSYPLKSQFGIFDLKSDGQVTAFTEKPTLDKWINIGYFYFDSKCRSGLLQSTDFVSYLQGAISRNELFSFRHEGIHITVNTITELHEAEKNISKFSSTFGGAE